MNVKIQSRRGALFLPSSAIPIGLAFTYTALAATHSVTIPATAVGTKQTPPVINKNDVDLFKNKERTQIANLRRSDSLFLAILIDDTLNQTVAGDFKDLRTFINAQSPDTYVAVAYARNGSAMVA